MQRAMLDYVDGVSADFENARLDNAILDNTALHGANFTNTTLTGALFREATVRKATFSGADISAANFAGAVGLDQQQIDHACAAPESPPILPAGLAPPPPCPVE